VPTAPTPPEDTLREWEARGLIPPGTARPKRAKATAARPLPPPGPVPVRVVVGPIPVTLRSEANEGGKLRAAIRRKGEVKATVRAALDGVSPPKLPVVVRVIRVGGKKLDSDNAVRAVKACRDEVARWLQVDDADPRVKWVVRQQPGWVQGVIIDVRTREATQ
jgi:hypothetical protein